MEQSNRTTEKQKSELDNNDQIVQEIQKINFSLSDIAGTLAFFKWLTILFIIFGLAALIFGAFLISRLPIRF